MERYGQDLTRPLSFLWQLSISRAGKYAPYTNLHACEEVAVFWVKSLNISQTHKLLDTVQNSQEVMLSQGFQEVHPQLQSLHHQEASDPENLVLG